MDRLKRIDLKQIVRIAAITAPVWLGMLTGVNVDHIVPVESAVVLIVGVGYLTDTDTPEHEPY
jgi:hypothetical protein